jgi:hypothetical protein
VLGTDSGFDVVDHVSHINRRPWCDCHPWLSLSIELPSPSGDCLLGFAARPQILGLHVEAERAPVDL